MEEKGQLMGVPIKLVMALVIGTMAMGVLTQFVGTATSSNRLTVRVYDAVSGDALGGATVVVKYFGGMKAHTLGTNSNQYTFTIPMEAGSYTVVTVRVTHSGYIPWEGEAAVHRTR